MSRFLFLLLPALVVQAESPIPNAIEIRPGVFVHQGTPDEVTCAAMKKAHITHVVDLRRDGEPSLTCESEASRLQEAGIQYIRYSVAKAPSDSDFDFLRGFIRDLPRGSKILLHCSNGNRAAAVVCPWLVLDKGMPLEEGIRLAKASGLKFPETEEAVRRYITSKARA